MREKAQTRRAKRVSRVSRNIACIFGWPVPAGAWILRALYPQSGGGVAHTRPDDPRNAFAHANTQMEDQTPQTVEQSAGINQMSGWDVKQTDPAAQADGESAGTLPVENVSFQQLDSTWLEPAPLDPASPQQLSRERRSRVTPATEPRPVRPGSRRVGPASAVAARKYARRTAVGDADPAYRFWREAPARVARYSTARGGKPLDRDRAAGVLAEVPARPVPTLSRAARDRWLVAVAAMARLCGSSPPPMQTAGVVDAALAAIRDSLSSALGCRVRICVTDGQMASRLASPPAAAPTHARAVALIRGSTGATLARVFAMAPRDSDSACPPRGEAERFLSVACLQAGCALEAAAFRFDAGVQHAQAAARRLAAPLPATEPRPLRVIKPRSPHPRLSETLHSLRTHADKINSLAADACRRAADLLRVGGGAGTPSKRSALRSACSALAQLVRSERVAAYLSVPGDPGRLALVCCESLGGVRPQGDFRLGEGCVGRAAAAATRGAPIDNGDTLAVGVPVYATPRGGGNGSTASAALVLECVMDGRMRDGGTGLEPALAGLFAAVAAAGLQRALARESAESARRESDEAAASARKAREDAKRSGQAVWALSGAIVDLARAASIGDLARILQGTFAPLVCADRAALLIRRPVAPTGGPSADTKGFVLAVPDPPRGVRAPPAVTVAATPNAGLLGKAVALQKPVQASGWALLACRESAARGASPSAQGVERPGDATTDAESLRLAGIPWYRKLDIGGSSVLCVPVVAEDGRVAAAVEFWRSLPSRRDGEADSSGSADVFSDDQVRRAVAAARALLPALTLAAAEKQLVDERELLRRTAVEAKSVASRAAQMEEYGRALAERNAQLSLATRALREATVQSHQSLVEAQTAGAQRGAARASARVDARVQRLASELAGPGDDPVHISRAIKEIVTEVAAGTAVRAVEQQPAADQGSALSGLISIPPSEAPTRYTVDATASQVSAFESEDLATSATMTRRSPGSPAGVNGTPVSQPRETRTPRRVSPRELLRQSPEASGLERTSLLDDIVQRAVAR